MPESIEERIWRRAEAAASKKAVKVPKANAEASPVSPDPGSKAPKAKAEAAKKAAPPEVPPEVSPVSPESDGREERDAKRVRLAGEFMLEAMQGHKDMDLRIQLEHWFSDFMYKRAVNEGDDPNHMHSLFPEFDLIKETVPYAWRRVDNVPIEPRDKTSNEAFRHDLAGRFVLLLISLKIEPALTIFLASSLSVYVIEKTGKNRDYLFPEFDEIENEIESELEESEMFGELKEAFAQCETLFRELSEKERSVKPVSPNAVPSEKPSSPRGLPWETRK